MVASHNGANAAPFPLTAIDREQLALSDAEFEAHTWDELKQIIGLTNSLRLQNLHVRRSDLYLQLKIDWMNSSDGRRISDDMLDGVPKPKLPMAASHSTLCKYGFIGSHYHPPQPRPDLSSS
jgi:hypothetical protein